eukprot:CAMPEP_0201482902 /NCGR_PEP_ID=MMETSP0151_2-20130828/7159_1 /ASSEMBLY_ACC=CAM_ASM_000257 /TAXON_ID=200890 /ORGANISM="Paramoeba atlantica, Strain 621/1 / CCAP 1560/9" /LENGTH=273 /DNA_ID=CAMNT_0047865813 /DNA_START=75 /DNA_END=896 /DNA_ORIENTATION=+
MSESDASVLPHDPSSLLFLAKLAEQTERFEDMVRYVKGLAALKPELSPEERNLLSVAYKNVIGARRAAWRVVAAALTQHESVLPEGESGETEDATRTALREYKSSIECEVGEVCTDIVTLLEGTLLPAVAEDAETRVFYLKMEGDYYRYHAETLGEEKADAPKRHALEAYRTATELAEPVLSPTHPIRLGLALNFSVFYYEILHDFDKGCAMAQKAFDDACPDLESLDEENYKESALILHLLRDNLALWRNEGEDAENSSEGSDASSQAENSQ